MRGFLGLTKRNILVYFKDFQAVIFSLMTSIIVFALYLLFLKDSYVESIENSMKGLEDYITSGNVEMLVNLILLTGILGSALITVPYNCLTTIVSDKEKKIDYDILATPIKRWKIIVSYFLSATISAIIMSSIILTTGLLILKSMGDLYISSQSVAYAYLLIVVGACSTTALFMIVIMFFKTVSSAGAFSGLLSAASGFVIGAYIPTSEFSEEVQTFCNIFPGTHTTVVFRNLLIKGLLKHIDNEIGGIDKGNFVKGMKETFAFNISFLGDKIKLSDSVLYVIIMTFVSVLVMIFVYNKTYKRKS
ncbi:multidrug/hemolysin transport system permease protein [Acetitomaculum ruminis DSM 5522]|uniref:Multidrug/hemolysin transport system permease protein n=1 Tax=Acetitomaculum ruminis DSM 5522 TaxID=1120918 RepID=A0A1I0XZS5_9FIRM|nr:ABC transporter permease [Acetitomaculum ruminis]SFB05708.1 multidrug/hemolysin transport system permease protein [Acetitomaculum ruminis DSM 5522]